MPSYTYQSVWEDSQKVNWQVNDLIGKDNPLDFTKPFLPEAIARVDEIECLTAPEKLILNHIRGNSYLHLFVLVERFIIPTILQQIQRLGYEDIYTTQALLCFAEEEGKHIHLFQAFAEAVEQHFHTTCHCVGPVEEIAAAILRHQPLSVLLLTLQFEWTTQSHYLESVRHNRDEDLEPRFCSLLKHHWMEEAQHTKLDTLLVYELTSKMSPSEIEAAIDDYLNIADLLDRTLIAQMLLDLNSLSGAIGRSLTESETEEIMAVQEQAYRWSFLCAGMTHPHFVTVLNTISPSGKARVVTRAKALSHESSQSLQPTDLRDSGLSNTG